MDEDAATTVTATTAATATTTTDDSTLAASIATMMPTLQVNRVRGLMRRLAHLEEVSARLGPGDLAQAVRMGEARHGAPPAAKSWTAVMARAESLESRVLLLEARAGLFGSVSNDLVQLARRLSLLESGVVTLPSSSRRAAGTTETRARVAAALEALGLQNKATFLRVPDAEHYYAHMTLEQRAALLGAPSTAHLCKTLLLSATGGRSDADVEDGSDDAPLDPNEVFVLAVVQYDSKLDATALRNAIRAMNIVKPGVAVRPCVASPARAAKVLGFLPNGAAPVGGLRPVPLLVSKAIASLEPPIVYLGGGDPDVKLVLSDVREFIAKTNAVVAKMTEARFLGKEGAAFHSKPASMTDAAASPLSTPSSPAKQPAAAAPAPTPLRAPAGAGKSTPPTSSDSRKRKEPDPEGGGGDEGGDAGAPVTFHDLDCRVGLVTKAWKHPESAKLLCEEIDVGEGAPRPIASGLQAFYAPEEFQGKRVVVVCNLKPAKLGGYTSNGMVLCASWTDDATGAPTVRLLEPPADAKIGERVVVRGLASSAPLTAAQVKKRKVFETVATKLAVLPSGAAGYDGASLVAAECGKECVVTGAKAGAPIS